MHCAESNRHMARNYWDDQKADDLLPECILLKVAGGVIWPNEISLPCSSLDLIPDFELLPQELKLVILSLVSLV